MKKPNFYLFTYQLSTFRTELQNRLGLGSPLTSLGKMIKILIKNITYLSNSMLLLFFDRCGVLSLSSANPDYLS